MTARAHAPPAISVVVPHLNQPEHLARCLASLRAQENAPPAELIVVDNGSQALPEAVCAAHGATLLTEPTPGPGPARNRGVAAARAPILAFVDADCRADPGWLAAIAARFEDTETTILGGDVRIPRADPARPTTLECYESEYAYRMDLYIRDQGFTGTGNLAVRRRTLDEVGPFAGIELAEDRDWGRRARAKGHRIVYVPEMRVWHPAREDFAGLEAKWARQIGHDRAQVRGAAAEARWIAKALALAVSPVWAWIRIARSDRISGPRERLLAWLALARVRAFRAGLMLRVAFGADAAARSRAWNRG